MRGCFSSFFFREWFKTRLTSKDFCYTQEEEDKKQENQGVRGVGEGGLAGYGSVHHQNRASCQRLHHWGTTSMNHCKDIYLIIQPSPSHLPPIFLTPPFSLSSTYV
jgi:hypothetical protein